MSYQLREDTLDEYTRLFKDFDPDNVTLFHHPAWLRAVADGLNWELSIIRIDGPSIVGFLPGFSLRKGPFYLFGSPLKGSMTPYVGPVFLAGMRPGKEAMPKLLHTVTNYCHTSMGVDSVEIGLKEFPPKRLRSLSEHRCRISQPETYIIDLQQGHEALWSALGYSGRRKVRKARKCEVEIVRAESASVIDVFYEMLEVTFARRNTLPFHPKSLFSSLYEYLVPEHMLEVLIARYEGKAIATGLFAHNDDEIHFVSGASWKEAYEVAANNLLQWHLIEWSATQGMETYDMGGKGIPGVDRFKELFGPRVHEYTIVSREVLTARIARELYQYALPLYQRVRARWMS